MHTNYLRVGSTSVGSSLPSSSVTSALVIPSGTTCALLPYMCALLPYMCARLPYMCALPYVCALACSSVSALVIASACASPSGTALAVPCASTTCLALQQVRDSGWTDGPSAAAVINSTGAFVCLCSVLT